MNRRGFLGAGAALALGTSMERSSDGLFIPESGLLIPDADPAPAAMFVGTIMNWEFRQEIQEWPHVRLTSRVSSPVILETQPTLDVTAFPEEGFMNYGKLHDHRPRRIIIL